MKIGLALGSGASRGWSHIGVIRALADAGVTPDIVCGTSVGALVGASYAAGNLDSLEQWVRSLTRLETARFFEIKRSFNGFVNTERLHQFLNRLIAGEETSIENLPKRYAAVATNLETGREIWLENGSVLEAVWASISLPGLFPAIRVNKQWLADGGLVNPVPVSLCRALGADVVIAVNLNGDIVGKHFHKPEPATRQGSKLLGKLGNIVSEYTPLDFSRQKNRAQPPGLFESIAGSINIMQDRITRSRMAGDPPEIVLSPRLSHIGLLEFYRAAEAIDEGRNSVGRMLPEITRLPVVSR